MVTAARATTTATPASAGEVRGSDGGGVFPGSDMGGTGRGGPPERISAGCCVGTLGRDGLVFCAVLVFARSALRGCAGAGASRERKGRSASRSASRVGKRAAGSRARARMTTAQRAGSRSGRRSRSSRGGCDTRATSIAA
jgi:hypothetical protein